MQQAANSDISPTSLCTSVSNVHHLVCLAKLHYCVLPVCLAYTVIIIYVWNLVPLSLFVTMAMMLVLPVSPLVLHRILDLLVLVSVKWDAQQLTTLMLQLVHANYVLLDVNTV